jgi:hypothetical protein
MATPTIKTTYALDLGTVKALDALAQAWKVSKSEALRRLIRASAIERPADSRNEALRALDAAQGSLALGGQAAARWSQSVRAERRATSAKRERRAR